MPGGYVGGRPKDTSKLSKDPKQIRNRIRKRGVALIEDMEFLYRKPLEEWDLEELARGRPRDKGGKFRGATPTWIDPAVAMEAKKRLIQHTIGGLSKHIDSAIKVVSNIMTDYSLDDKGKPVVDARTRLAAATWILENFIGKPKALVELSQVEDATRNALLPAIILDDGKPQGHLAKTIEGKLVGQDDD